jgi:hypothetical protein
LEFQITDIPCICCRHWYVSHIICTGTSDYAPEISGDAPEISDHAPEISGDAPEISDHAPEISGDAPEISGYAAELSDLNFHIMHLNFQIMSEHQNL